MDCQILDIESLIVQSGQFLTWISLLTVLHFIFAYIQGQIWKGERLWTAKTIFIYSLIYFPIGFLGFRAWTLFKLRGSRKEILIFLILFSLYSFIFWKCGIAGTWKPSFLDLSFPLGIGSSEAGVSCLTSTWPFSTPFAILSYLANFLFLHHIAWPIIELSFVISKFARKIAKN